MFLNIKYKYEINKEQIWAGMASKGGKAVKNVAERIDLLAPQAVPGACSRQLTYVGTAVLDSFNFCWYSEYL